MQRGPPAVQHVPFRNSRTQCDYSYFTTWPGIFEIVQVVSSLISFCCMETVWSADCIGCFEWFKIATMSGSIVSTVFLFLYFLHLIEKCDNITWLKIECVSSIIWTIFNLSAAVSIASFLHSCYDHDDRNGRSKAAAATAFGFIAMIAHACDAGLQLYRINKRIPAQG